MLLTIKFSFNKETKKVKIKVINPKLKKNNKIDEALDNFKASGKKKGLSKHTYRTLLYSHLLEYVKESKTESIQNEEGVEKEILIEAIVEVEDKVFLEKMDLLNQKTFVLA